MREQVTDFLKYKAEKEKEILTKIEMSQRRENLMQ